MMSHPFAVAKSHLRHIKHPSSFCILKKGCILAIGTQAWNNMRDLSTATSFSVIHIVNVEDNFGKLGEMKYQPKVKKPKEEGSKTTTEEKIRYCEYEKLVSLEDCVPNTFVAVHRRQTLEGVVTQSLQVCDVEKQVVVKDIPIVVAQRHEIAHSRKDVLVMNEKSAVFSFALRPALYFQDLSGTGEEPAEHATLTFDEGFYPSCLVKINRTQFAVLSKYQSPAPKVMNGDLLRGSVQIWDCEKKICTKVIDMKDTQGLKISSSFPRVRSPTAGDVLDAIYGYIPMRAQYFEEENRVVALCQRSGTGYNNPKSLLLFIDLETNEVSLKIMGEKYNSLCFHLEFFILAGDSVEMIKDDEGNETICKWKGLEYAAENSSLSRIQEGVRRLNNIRYIDVLRSDFFDDTVICLEQNGIVLYEMNSIMRYMSHVSLKKIRASEKKDKRKDKKEMSSTVVSDFSDKDLLIQLDNMKIYAYKSLVFSQSKLLEAADKLDFEEEITINNEVFLNILFGKVFTIEEEIEILDYFFLFHCLKMEKQCCLICKELRNVYGLKHLIDLLAASIVYFETEIPDEEESDEEEEDQEDEGGVDPEEEFVEKMRQFQEDQHLEKGEFELKVQEDGSIGIEPIMKKQENSEKKRPVKKFNSIFTVFLLEQIQEDYLFDLRYSPKKMKRLRKLGFTFDEMENCDFETKEKNKKWKKWLELSQGQVFKMALLNLHRLSREKSSLCNLKLITSTGEVFVNKEIVRAYSAFFYRMLEFRGAESMSVEKEGTLVIESLNHAELVCLVEFIYTGKIQSDDLRVLLRLLDFCEAFFEYKLKYFLIQKMRKIPVMDLRQLKYVFGDKRILEILIGNIKIINYFVEYWVVSLKITKEKLFEFIQDQFKLLQEE